jgi:hypothetical protein
MQLAIRASKQEQGDVVKLIETHGVPYTLAERKGFDGVHTVDIILQYGPAVLTIIGKIMDILIKAKELNRRVTIDISDKET